MRWTITTAGLAALLLLPGCGSSDKGGPHRVQATAPSITFSYQGDQLDDATDRATNYCRRYSQEAKLTDLNTREGLHYATYECR
jgi:hypothetical protein